MLRDSSDRGELLVIRDSRGYHAAGVTMQHVMAQLVYHSTVPGQDYHAGA